ncbi:MAG: gamma-glutamyltranspeptidase / glutathione hydrolase, partial [Solirubrobacteraceae bacterium]|nr:gamma-glutamyltranspeptidase / glutathione hydrolase [Solirubrobacteraceae bacterium]
MIASRGNGSGHAGAVASPHSVATEAGAEVLAAGGNALDAAIVTNAMLGVVYPHMCGVGGDMLLLYYEADTGTVHCLNGTGAAPALATPGAFAERGLDAVPVRGPLPVTVPGGVGAWDAAITRFGTRPLADLLGPAIAAAEHGITVTDRLAAWIADSQADLSADPALRRLFLGGDSGTPVQGGQTLRQPDLAATLRRIAQAGATDLYTGELAREIDAAMREAGGLLRAEDLAAYSPEWVVPISTRHGGLDILTTPPNSQGVAALLMLQDIGELDGPLGSTEYVESFVAAKRRAIGLRDAYVTDPRHMTVTTDELLDPSVPSAAAPSPPPRGDTVYLCTVDGQGNACSLIQSIYYAFGSCFTAGDTGILFHNRGHYFSLDPAATNVIAPGKRTLHTLMASMALAGGRPRFVFGTMGADGQPQGTVQVLHQLLAGATAQEAVSAPRILHGKFTLEDDPETLHIESDYGAETLDALGGSVPALNVVPPHSERMGHAHAIAIAPDGTLTAGADPRSDGSAA